jgi:hypothetical protein
MHPIIEQLPEVQRADAEIERLRERRDLISKAAKRDGAEIIRAQEEHAQAVREALDRGEAPPPKPAIPEHPDYSGPLHQIQTDMRLARERKREAVRKAAPQVRAQIEHELRAVAGEVAAVLADHGDLRERWHGLMAARASLPGTPSTLKGAYSWEAMVGEALR